MPLWDGVPPIRNSSPCDICFSKDGVEHEQLPLKSSGWTEEVETGDYVQSNLCLKCRDKGWFVLSTCFQLIYSNINTGESKTT